MIDRFITLILSYNTMFGPFHFNEEEFIRYIKQYNKEQSFLSQFSKIKYVQVELNENNIQNPLTTYDTIRQYSDPITRRNHIATYKRMKRPSIYVKLPTQSQEYFHKHYPIRFQLYSIRTLQCIIKNLPSASKDIYRTWIEKSNYIEYIYKEYAKNSTEFNKSVLTKCGLLIGHIYRPFHDEAFVRTYQYKFLSTDIALNMTERYDPFFSFLIGGLIFLWLFFKSLFYLIFYLLNNIRLKFYQQISIFSYSLKLSPDIIEELLLLNIDGFPHEQLLKLDELIQENFSWIPWPTNEQNYADWLHKILIEISDVYKQRYEENLRYEQDNRQSSYFTDESLNNFISTLSRILRRQSLINTTNEYNSRLKNLIHEENNIQRMKIERQNIVENLETLHDRISPASAEFIARFRLDHERNKRIININMMQKQIQCTICQENFELDDQYATWPCPGEHIFHYECMLKSLRMRNTCPNCRHEVEGVPLASIQAMVTQFLYRLFI